MRGDDKKRILTNHFVTYELVFMASFYLNKYIFCFFRFLARLYTHFDHMTLRSISYWIFYSIYWQIPLLPGMVDGIGNQLVQRRQLYSGTMSKLRMLMISRMAKPEEVLIVEDENGNIVRETMKDNDVLVQYKVKFCWITVFYWDHFVVNHYSVFSI